MWGSKDIASVIFLVSLSLMLIIFICSVVYFMFLYSRKKLIHEKEKAALNEQHLKELFFTRLEIQQQTMQDIGREIHDNVNQKLTLASLYNYQLEHEHGPTRTGDKLAAISGILNEAMADLRGLSKTLAEDKEDSPILSLTEEECRRINAMNICSAGWRSNKKEIVLPATLRNYVHRIMQEFLQNSIKHSKCKHIEIGFEEDEKGLCVLLKDDGCGFDTGSRKGAGIGLANMKKRSELLGIDMLLRSTVNEGTEVQLLIPKNKLNRTPDGI